MIDIAIAIDDFSKHPVDVEHILAAMVLAARAGELKKSTVISSDDKTLMSTLAHHVETVFEKFDGKVGRDE